MAAVLAAIAGLGWGFVSDRIAARWPAHEGGAVRPVDWRTPVVIAFGAAAGFLVVDRFGGAPFQLLVMGVLVIAVVLLFATDLDQRLLPDAVTYPLIGLAVAAALLGWGPYVNANLDSIGFAAVAAVVAPGALYLLSIPFGQGAIGQGDLKLLVSVGLLAGPMRLFLGLVTGAILAAVVIVALLALRRITLKTYVPYGPFLIAGAVWALLAIVDA
jgi:leader peptidase (prepilin peptidase) / N-methyltransferase